MVSILVHHRHRGFSVFPKRRLVDHAIDLTECTFKFRVQQSINHPSPDFDTGQELGEQQTLSFHLPVVEMALTKQLLLFRHSFP